MKHKQKQKQKPLLMFDFDGVLVNTLLMCYEINAETDKDLTLPEYQALFSGNITEMVKNSKFKGNPNFYGRYAEEGRSVTIPEDIKVLVRKLSETYVLSIVSGSATAAIQEIVVREGLSDHFADILGYDIDTSKVVRIKMLLKKYSAKPDDTVFVTDTSGDVHEAAECEVAAIAVTWGFQDKETLAEANPMAYVDTVEQLGAAIELFFEQ